jgi:hypothetical protein
MAVQERHHRAMPLVARLVTSLLRCRPCSCPHRRRASRRFVMSCDSDGEDGRLSSAILCSYLYMHDVDVRTCVLVRMCMLTCACSRAVVHPIECVCRVCCGLCSLLPLAFGLCFVLRRPCACACHTGLHLLWRCDNTHRALFTRNRIPKRQEEEEGPAMQASLPQKLESSTHIHVSIWSNAKSSNPCSATSTDSEPPPRASARHSHSGSGEGRGLPPPRTQWKSTSYFLF